MCVNFDNKCTFDNYIVSSCNEEAYILCRSIINDTEGEFAAIYGPSSCGKTHLLKAVKYAYQEKYPTRKVLMSTYEEIISLYLDSLRKKKSFEFQKFICSYDLILIDNMQFAANKSTTQEEFSFLFSEVLDLCKSIIIAWDKPMWCMDELLKRMKERYPGRCFISEIREPDIALRERYIERLIKRNSFSISDEILKVIAGFRDIPLYAFNGLLNKFEVFQEQKGEPMTNQEVIEFLNDYTR